MMESLFDPAVATSEAQTNPPAVMHKAIIVTPNESERRIVDSMLLVAPRFSHSKINS